MNAFRQLMVCAGIGIMAGTLSPAAAMAGEGYGPTTRAEVKSAVMEARRMGALQPAGQAVEPRGYRTTDGVSATTRDEVRADVRAASAQRALIPAGEGIAPSAQPFESTLARAEVKQEVVRARRDGELIAAGEGFGPVERTARTAAHEGTKVASRR